MVGPEQSASLYAPRAIANRVLQLRFRERQQFPHAYGSLGA